MAMRFPEKKYLRSHCTFFYQKFPLSSPWIQIRSRVPQGGAGLPNWQRLTQLALPQSAVLGECNANVFHGSCGMITAQPGGQWRSGVWHLQTALLKCPWLMRNGRRPLGRCSAARHLKTASSMSSWLARCDCRASSRPQGGSVGCRARRLQTMSAATFAMLTRQGYRELVLAPRHAIKYFCVLEADRQPFV